MSFCNVTMLGTVGMEPRQATTSTGKPVCSFSLAIKEGFKESEKTFWINVTVFGQQATVCGKYVHKGSMLAVTGRLSMDEYTNKNGQRVQTPKVVGEHIDFISSRLPQYGSGNGGYGATVPPPAPQQQYGQVAQQQETPPPFGAPSQTPDTPPEGTSSNEAPIPF